jgi:hypothetical protein
MMTRAHAVEVHAAMSIVSGAFHLNNAPVRLTPYHIKVCKNKCMEKRLQWRWD